MRRADTGDAAGHNLAALGNKGRKHSYVFIVNVVDLFNAEPANFLAPEILLLGGQRFIAAGGPHGPANGTSASLFGHLTLLPSPPREPRPPERRAWERRVSDRWVPPRPPWHALKAHSGQPAAQAYARRAFR